MHSTSRFLKYLFAVAIVFVSLSVGCLYSTAWETVEYRDVYVGSKKLLVITDTHMKLASERADDINDRLTRILSDPSTDPSTLAIRVGIDGVPVVVLGNLAVCHITDKDALANNQSKGALAQHVLETLRAELKHAHIGRNESRAAEKHGNTPLSEHAVLLLFLEIAILLLVSLVCGELFVRVGQPAIIGQIVGGLLLGQTFFGNLFPDLSSSLFPQDGSQSKLIEAVSWIGVSFLLMLTGMETDMAMLKRLGKPALYIAVIGLIGPLLGGGLASLLLPSSLMADSQQKLAFAVFLGTVFAASSVPVVAKILMDMKLIRRDIGQLVLSASLSHDLLCCMLLAVIAVLSGSGQEGGNALGLAAGGTACFVIVMYLGRPVFFSLLRWVNDKVSTKDGLITAMAVLLLSSAAATEAVGVHIVLGAFAAGVILSQAPVINQKVVRPLETVTMGFFAPIFFASAGLNVNLATLLEPRLAVITVLLSLAALLLKIASCGLAGKLTGMSQWESLSVGIGSNTKGSLGLILAMLGYSLGIISLDMFAIVIFISLFSTAVAPTLLKWSLAKVTVTDAEKERMAKDERCARTMLSSIRRVLWPTSGKGRNRFIGKLLDSIGSKQVLETTVFWVKTAGDATARPFASVSDAIDRKHVGILERTVKSNNPIEAIVEEGNRGYDLLVMATDKPSADANHVFGTLVDSVVIATATRVLVVYEPEQSNFREIKNVLVPVSGTELSISAGEFGISLANSLNAKVTCLCISESDSHSLYSESTRSGEKIERNITDEIEGSLTELSHALDVDFRAVLMQTSSHPAQAIILEAQRSEVDLIVMGAEPKLGKGLFLGHSINFVLRNAPCAVAILKLSG